MIDHDSGPFLSKAWSKLGPKMLRAQSRQPWGPGMQERMRANYVSARIQRAEDKNPAKSKYYKDFGDASMTAVQNMNRRGKKKLP